MHIVIDSSLVVGLLVPNDCWHSQSVGLWEAINAADHIGVYFDCVAAEAISAAARRLHEKGRGAEVAVVLDKLNTLASPQILTWILSDVPRLYSEVLALMRTSSGELNFNDALIALACRERNIPAIASFDADFDQIPWLKRIAEPGDI